MLWGAIVIAQLFAFAQAITGSILIARYDLEAPRLHALYGFSAVIAVGILYSYRTSTFMRGKEYLLYGGGCLFIMGLGLRETLSLS
jgi:cyanate permease